MTFRRAIDRLLRPRPTAPIRRSRLGVECLEGREVPAVTLRTLPDAELPDNRPLFVPVTASNAVGAVTVSASTDNANVRADVVQGGRTVQFDVTGTDNAGVAFTGTISMRLFEDVAPLATGTIIGLVNDGFYDNKLFHRIIDGFIIQGGSPNGDGIGGSSRPDVADEFNRDFTFASRGIVAMANAGDDNNNSQFFITDIDIPLAQRPEHLNFNHSIVGLLTSGFDIYQQIITTRLNGSTPVNPVTITKARVLTDTTNAVVRLTPTGTVTGAVNVTIQADDGTGATTQTTALVATPDPVNSRAFLNSVAAPVIGKDTPGSFTLSGTDIDSDQLTFAVGVPGNLFGTVDATQATVSLDQATGKVSVTPASGFTGTIDLLVGVRDQTDRAGGGSLNAAGNFDTQRVTVTVRAPAAVTVALAVSQPSVQPMATVVLTANVTGDGSPNGTVQFLADGAQIGATPVSNGQARLSTSFDTAGVRNLTALFVPGDGAFQGGSSAGVALDVSTAAPTTVELTATGARAGSEPRVVVTNADGSERFNFLAFESSFTGGVRVATGDVTQDGQDDIVVTPGFGGAPLIRIYDGVTGALAREVMVFEDTFRGGLNVSLGDALNLGYQQILVGAGFTGGPRVTVFDHVQDKVLLNYFAFDPTFRGGVSIDIADLQGTGKLNLIAGPGKGGGPVVRVYNPLVTALPNEPVQLGQFSAGDAASRDGIRVGVGGVNADGRRNILVGPAEPDTAPLSASFDPVAQGVNFGTSG